MRVLVTGATGYLGRAIVRALARRGHEPVVFARHASAAGMPGRAVDGDVRDERAVAAAAEGVGAICHVAALVSLWRPRPADFDDVNVGGLRTAIAVCERLGIERLVYTSSFLALPPAGRSRPLNANDYQRTKALALDVAREAAARGVPVVSTFPGVIYGPGIHTEGNLVGRLVRDHLDRRLPGVVGADRVWSFSYVDDVADAHAAAAERGQAGGEYMLGGENVPQIRLFEILRASTGRRLPRRIPHAMAWAAGWIDELRARASGRPPLVTRGAVEIFRHDWPLDSARSIRDLGLRVRPLEEGVGQVLTDIETSRR